MPRRASRSFANVTSLLALVVALSGTAYAAVTITGKNVKDGSLTGADVKNGSLQAGDLAAGAAGSAQILTKTFSAPAGGPPGETYYLSVTGDNSAVDRFEEGAKQIMPAAGTIGDMIVKTGLPVSAPATFTLRISGANSKVGCTVAAGENSCSSSASADVRTGDTLVTRLDGPNWRGGAMVAYTYSPR
jgi:hypothetical protein